MLQGQADVGAEVDGKGHHVDGPTSHLVAQVAEEERRHGLHDLVDGHAQVDLADGAAVVAGNGRDGGQVDEGGEGREERAEDGHEDDEGLDSGREDGMQRSLSFRPGTLNCCVAGLLVSRLALGHVGAGIVCH